MALSANVSAEPRLVMGQAIDVAPPATYCVLGKTQREIDLLNRYKEQASPTGEILQVVAPCQDVKQFNSGEISSFLRSAQVMVVKSRGILKKESRSRVQFLADLGGERKVDLNAVNSQVERLLKDPFAPALTGMTPLGSDGSAFYWLISGSITDDSGNQKRVASVMGALLINELPLSVQATEREDAPDGLSPASLAQNYVRAILRRNEPPAK